MKCPLISIGYLASERIDASKKCECGREECAWWDSAYGSCDPTGLAHTLERLTDTLAELVRKMPHELQFRRKP